MSLLEVRHLSVSFHTASGTACAVRDVDFTLEDGEVLGIIGESGSGKSVTALTIMGLLDNTAQVDSGEVRFSGTDLLQLKQNELCRIRGNEISMIFQEPSMALNPVQRIKKQLREVYKIHFPERLPGADAEILAMLKRMRIPDAEQVMNKYPFELSGGLKQRIMIAMALLSHPRVLIADEPTTALDVTTQAEILELLKEMKREEGCSVLFITHDLGVIAEMADHVVVMYRGEVVENNSVLPFFQHACHPYSRALLDARPEHFDGKFSSIVGTIPDAYEPMEGCGFSGRCGFASAECRTIHPELQKLGDGASVRCLKYGGLSDV